jgi:hypothetical protein
MLAHFTSLDSEDRRLRFGAPLRDEAIANYVERIDFVRDGVFAVHDGTLRLLAVVHVAFRRPASKAWAAPSSSAP